jgi:16S rRNA (guanine966-N2)-methyltransferase
MPYRAMSITMSKKQAGTVRIIGGKWRGTRLPVRDIPGLRPTSDRGRETLFNWLQTHIRGAMCADLFAGTGVLGLEAASRGASRVVLLEKSRDAADDIRQSLAKLKADQAEVIEGDALAWLARCAPGSLDIVFVDPPFGQDLEARVMELLSAGDCVRNGGFVYLETARDARFDLPGPAWEVSRETIMGDVQIRLLKKI